MAEKKQKPENGKFTHINVLMPRTLLKALRIQTFTLTLAAPQKYTSRCVCVCVWVCVLTNICVYILCVVCVILNKCYCGKFVYTLLLFLSALSRSLACPGH